MRRSARRRWRRPLRCFAKAFRWSLPPTSSIAGACASTTSQTTRTCASSSETFLRETVRHLGYPLGHAVCSSHLLFMCMCLLVKCKSYVWRKCSSEATTVELTMDYDLDMEPCRCGCRHPVYIPACLFPFVVADRSYTLDPRTKPVMTCRLSMGLCLRLDHPEVPAVAAAAAAGDGCCSQGSAANAAGRGARSRAPPVHLQQIRHRGGLAPQVSLAARAHHPCRDAQRLAQQR